jgi:hypothetical protein
MRICLINSTRNRGGWEDATARKLASVWASLGFECHRTDVASVDDFGEVRANIDSYEPEFIVILAHGRSGERLDAIDAFEVDPAVGEPAKALLRSFAVYGQLLGEPQARFFLLVAVCEGQCTDSLAEFPTLNNLEGIIASRGKVERSALIDFVKEMFGQLSPSVVNTFETVEAAVAQARSQGAEFDLVEPARVTEE